MNSDLYPATVDIDSGVAVSFNRRDFRIYDESSQLTVDAATINADFPTNNSTQYRAIFYDGEAPVIDTGWNAGEASFAAVTRNKILRYYIGIPSDLTVKVYTRHTYESVVYESLYVAEHTATAYSTLLAGDVFLGVLDTEQVGTAWEAPSTGDYDFTLEIALAGDVIAIVNGGAPQTIISSGNTEGTLTGITASDIIEIWHEDSASSDEVFLEIDSPSHTEDAYAVLIFEGLLGGFGRGGFGRDMFGR